MIYRHDLSHFIPLLMMKNIHRLFAKWSTVLLVGLTKKQLVTFCVWLPHRIASCVVVFFFNSFQFGFWPFSFLVANQTWTNQRTHTHVYKFVNMNVSQFVNFLQAIFVRFFFFWYLMVATFSIRSAFIRVFANIAIVCCCCCFAVVASFFFHIYTCNYVCCCSRFFFFFCSFNLIICSCNKWI